MGTVELLENKYLFLQMDTRKNIQKKILNAIII